MMQKYQDSSLSPEERASDLLAQMNLDEKFGQIQCYNAIDSFLGKSVEKQNPYGVGQVCILIATMLDDVGSAAGLIARLQKQIMESGKHHIPAIFHIETLTGVMVTAATSFPAGWGRLPHGTRSSSRKWQPALPDRDALWESVMRWLLCSISAVTRALVVWEKPTARTRPLPLRWGQPM